MARKVKRSQKHKFMFYVTVAGETRQFETRKISKSKSEKVTGELQKTLEKTCGKDQVVVNCVIQQGA